MGEQTVDGNDPDMVDAWEGQRLSPTDKAGRS